MSKYIRIKILKLKEEVQKGIKYNRMQIINATADYGTSSKITDAIKISIPDGVKSIHVEALAHDEFNIFYNEKEGEDKNVRRSENT